MPTGNSTIQQPGNMMTCPVPSASPELVARWLGKMRIGAMCGLAVVVSHAVYLVLGVIGIAPGTRLANAISCAITIVGGIGVWLLVSSEPHNPKWLWPCRWALRLITVALVLLCVESIVVYGFFRNLPVQGINHTAWQDPMNVGVCGSWLLLYWYLKTLSHRLADTTLRKNFAVLLWLFGVMFVLGLLLLTCEGRTHYGSIQSPSATAPAWAQTQSSVRTFLGFSVQIAYYVWEGWLMWRLSRRLNQFGRVGILPHVID